MTAPSCVQVAVQPTLPPVHVLGLPASLLQAINLGAQLSGAVSQASQPWLARKGMWG